MFSSLPGQPHRFERTVARRQMLAKPLLEVHTERTSVQAPNLVDKSARHGSIVYESFGERLNAGGAFRLTEASPRKRGVPRWIAGLA